MNQQDAMDRLLRGWLDAEVSDLTPPSGLHTHAMALVRNERQRPKLLSALHRNGASGVQGARIRDGWAFAVGVAVMIVVAIGALAVGYRGFVDHPATTPLVPAPPTASPSLSPSSSPSPSDAAASSAGIKGRVAYVLPEAVNCPAGRPPVLCRPISTSWLANADGSAAQPLVGVPLGWSFDGGILLLQDDAELVIADETGSQLERIAISNPSCKDAAGCTGQPATLCSDPCSEATDFALSPDGTRVAFIRSFPNNDDASVVAILDLATRSVSELPATRVTNSARCQEQSSCDGADEAPRWAPDGTHMAFARQGISPDTTNAWTAADVLIVNADGSGLRRLTPAGTDGFDPEWSPDGQRLLFTGGTAVVNGSGTGVDSIRTDIFAIDANGDGLVRLTQDGMSSYGEWTADGRVAFIRQVGPGDFANWVMDVDGGNQSLTGGTLGALASAGCTTCVYPLSPEFPDFIRSAYWSGEHP